MTREVEESPAEVAALERYARKLLAHLTSLIDRTAAGAYEIGISTPEIVRLLGETPDEVEMRLGPEAVAYPSDPRKEIRVAWARWNLRRYLRQLAKQQRDLRRNLAELEVHLDTALARKVFEGDHAAAREALAFLAEETKLDREEILRRAYRGARADPARVSLGQGV